MRLLCKFSCMPRGSVLFDDQASGSSADNLMRVEDSSWHVQRLCATLTALAVVWISLEHWPVRIGILIVLRIRAGDVIRIAYGDRRIGLTVVDVKCFVQQSAIAGQFEDSIHFPSKRASFVRNKAASVPMRRSLLLNFILGLLQLPTVRVQDQLMENIIRNIDFGAFQVNIKQSRRVNQWLHFGIGFNVLARVLLTS